MNFDKIPPVPTAKDLLDNALRKSRVRTGAKSYKGKKIDSMKSKELSRIQIVSDSLGDDLIGIAKSFPSFDALGEFYETLVRIQLDYTLLKKSLGSMNWAKTKLKDIGRFYAGKISKSATPDAVAKHRKAYIGRVSSIIKQISKNLSYLHEARRVLRTFPSLKEMKTVALYGFPNVGKSTLLSRLTPSNPKIANYAFTTKTLNVGYWSNGRKEVQIIDTPGTLNRFDKMNNIEQMAEIAIKTVTDKVIVVIDSTDTYTIELQMKLVERAKKYGKPYGIFVSKLDMESSEEFKETKLKAPLGVFRKKAELEKFLSDLN